jgi:TonB family protein
MIAGSFPSEIRRPAPVPQLLVELPSRPRVFMDNLRDLFFPRPLPRLELQSAPAPFWPDVFVKRELPWRRFLDSGACHLIAFALFMGVAHLIALQPQAVLKRTLDHDQVIYYQASEYLPALDTRRARSARPRKADPEYSRQPIISVPAEADNRSQTIIAPPSVKLKRDVALPNIVAWSDKGQRPRLEIPAVPLTFAADISRVGPQLENSVVTPPPDAAHLARHRNSVALQSSVVAPPPSVESASARPIGDLNIGRSAVIAPAPQLAVSEQRTISGGRTRAIGGIASQVVAPPPSLPGSSGESFGSRGRVIALNLHPAVGAPADPPPGNRRGTFAAAPEGHTGASGSPGSAAGKTAAGKEDGSASKGRSDLPAGLYVGSAAAAKTAPANPGLAASIPSRSPQQEGSAKLSEAERNVFGNRKFYSLSLNMPNLNSAGGSWVIHFAELNHESNNYDANNRDGHAPRADLSQPSATRKVDPAYPMQLMRENVAGTVILYAIIHVDGTVGQVRVLRGVNARLDQFAREAVAQWKFDPATRNGAPVDVEATFQIPFRPPRVGSSF